MKKASLLMAALCAGVLFSAELPDFAKAETWKKASWTQSNYNAADGVMTIDRPKDAVPNGSGAWQSTWFEVKPGESFSGSVDVHFISQEATSHGRVGIDYYGADNKRVQFFDCTSFYQTNGAFETKKFTCKPAPEGAVKACIFLCFDGFGKIEFKNVKISQ